jgi:hypothetical protein
MKQNLLQWFGLTPCPKPMKYCKLSPNLSKENSFFGDSRLILWERFVSDFSPCVNVQLFRMSVGRLVASRTAMFCCDMQDKFRPSIRHFPAILSNANRMLQSAKLLDIPLVVTEQYPKGVSFKIEP